MPDVQSADYSKFYTTQSHPLHGGGFVFSFLLHPVHAETQPLFEFTFKGMQLTWTCLAQEFVDSPAVFFAAVKRVLNTVINLPSTVCVLNYTDDISISAKTEANCLQA